MNKTNERKKVGKYSSEGIRRLKEWLKTYKELETVKRTSPETHIKPLSSLEDEWPIEEWDGRDYLERD